MDVTLVIFYITIWVILYLLYRKRTAYFGAGSFIIISNIIYAVCSLLYLYRWGNDMPVTGFTLMPFLYLIISIFIFSSPIFKYEIKDVGCIKQPNLSLVDSFSIAYIICTIVVAPIVFKNLVSGISLIMLNANGGAMLYEQNAIENSVSTSGGVGIRNIFVLFYGFFTDISIFVFFYYFTLKKRRVWIQIGLGLTLIVSTLRWISLGTRTGVMSNVFTMIIAYLLLVRFMQPQIKKKVKQMLIIISVIIVIPLMALTMSRKGNEALDSLYEYFGQANLYFNKYGLDAGGIRYGDRTMGYFKFLSGLNPRYIDGIELRQKYSDMDIDDGHFYTFVGDFTLDYGPYFAFLFFIAVAIIMNKMVKYRRNEILFHHLILVFFISCIVVQGGMYLFNYSLKNNGTIIAFILFYWLFLWDYYNSKKKKIGIR